MTFATLRVTPRTTVCVSGRATQHEQFILEIYGRVQDQIKAQHSSVVLNEDDVIGLLYDCGFGEYYEASISDDN